MAISSELSETDLVPINQVLENKSTEEIIRWSLAAIPRTALLTSGQRAGSVLAKIIYQMNQSVDLVFADTGVLFPETHETINQIHQKYNFPLKKYSPPLSMEEQIKKYGVLYLNHAGQEQCCHMRKVEPLMGINHDYDLLLGPLRRSEGGRRSHTPIVDLDTNFNVIRVNPMANLADSVYDQYLNEEDTIINPLHAQGFPTIGCTRCTTPVREDEPERAGRWRHLSGVDYCGINPSDFSKKVPTIKLHPEVVQRFKNSLETL